MDLRSDFRVGVRILTCFDTILDPFWEVIWLLSSGDFQSRSQGLINGCYSTLEVWGELSRQEGLRTSPEVV